MKPAKSTSKILLALGLTFAGLATTGCHSTAIVPHPESEETMGGATPAASPASENPAGSVVDFPAITDVESAGEIVALRSGDKLTVGTPEQLLKKSAQTVDIDAKCGDLTSTRESFILACGDKVLSFPATNPSQPKTLAVEEDFPVTAATQLSSGELFVASNASAKVAVYKDGKRTDSFPVSAPTDQLVAVDYEKYKDNVVRTWNKDTTIQSLDWQNSREGGRLRVGRGLGQISAGTNGVLVVSDTMGGRVAIYSAEDVIRLHQFGNVDGIPWATAWDNENQLAWITTTDNNQVHAFKIASGVPELQGSLPTVADAQNMTVTSAGTVVIGSATGDGLEVITAPQL